MRILMSTILLTAFLSTKAQLPLLAPGFSPIPALGNTTNPTQKWQLKPYASLQAGYAFFHGGISYLSVPAGIALFHPLNNNFSAFAGVSAAPVAFSMSRLYNDPAANFSRPYGLGLNAGVQAGLIYTNDAKTFSISGSVGVERGSYPVYRKLPSPENEDKYHN